MQGLIDAQVTQLQREVPGSSVQARTVLSATLERLTLSLSYCGGPLSFLVDLHESALDLVPLEGVVAEQDMYDVFSAEALDSMHSWSPADEQGLVVLAAELVAACHAYQLARVENFPVASVQFNFEAVKHRPGLEMRVVPSEAGGAGEPGDVHLLFPLCDSSNEANAADAMASMGAKVQVVILRGGTATDVRLQLARPDRMPLTRACNVPKWSPQEPLWDYLQTLRAALADTWLKRRQLVEALVATFSVLEYDAVDYSSLLMMVKIKRGKQSLVRLVEFTFSFEFPEKPPVLSIHEFSTAKTWQLDPILYRYSPRWDVNRMGDELHQHACSQIPSLK